MPRLITSTRGRVSELTGGFRTVTQFALVTGITKAQAEAGLVAEYNERATAANIALKAQGKEKARARAVVYRRNKKSARDLAALNAATLALNEATLAYYANRVPIWCERREGMAPTALDVHHGFARQLGINRFSYLGHLEKRGEKRGHFSGGFPPRHSVRGRPVIIFRAYSD